MSNSPDLLYNFQSGDGAVLGVKCDGELLLTSGHGLIMYDSAGVPWRLTVSTTGQLSFTQVSF